MRTWKPLKAFLLLGTVLATPTVCMGARLLAEWSAVQATEPGRRVRLRLYEDLTPSGPLKVDGRFAAATSDSVTLILQNGSQRTFASRTVRRVARRRPVLKRTKAWVITGAVATAVVVITAQHLVNLFFGNDFTKNKTLRGIAIWAPPAWALATVTSSHVMIYNVPRKHRSP